MAATSPSLRTSAVIGSAMSRWAQIAAPSPEPPPVTSATRASLILSSPVRRQSAVARDHRSRRVSRLVAREEERDARDVVGGTEATEWHGRGQAGEEGLRVGHGLGD